MQRRANLWPRIASQSRFESISLRSPGRACQLRGRATRLEPANHLMACAAYPGREHPGRMIKSADQRDETTHCHDMIRKSESLPGHATERLLARQCKAASGLKTLPRYG